MRTYTYHKLAGRITLGLALGLFCLTPAAYALPTGGTSTTATIGTSGTTMNIGSSATNNVVNWSTYNVAQGETVAYDTHNYLNLIKGGEISKIYGSITGGGTIYLVNPSGVLFGSTASVNVGKLAVSTRPLDQVNASGFAASGADPLGTAATSAAGDITNIGTLKANSITLEGNNIILKGVANQVDATTATTRQTMAAGKLNLKAANNAYIGYQVKGTTQHSEIESDKSTIVYEVSDYANAATNLTSDKAPTTLGYTATKLDGTTSTTLFNSMYVANVYELQSMAYNLSGSYMLTGDIEAGSSFLNTKTWNEGKGFIPVGTEKVTSKSTADGIAFTGTFQGLDYEIKGLYINKSAPVDGTAYYDHGLFGYTKNAIIAHVGFDAATNVIGGDEATGALVGRAGSGTAISYVYNQGLVSGNNKVGGLVGEMQDASIVNSYNTGKITAEGKTLVKSAGGFVGGIVGTGKDGTTSSIINCYNTGAISVTTGGYAGGINGHNTGTISDCYNTGRVNANTYYAGGIAGTEYKTGTIADCYNIGDITANGNPLYGVNYSYVGGIAGALLGSPASIKNAYNTGTVTGAAMTGGIVGGEMGGIVSKVYNTGKVVSNNVKAGGISGYTATKGAVTTSALYATTDASGSPINQNLGNAKVGTAVTYADLLKTSTYTVNGWTVDSTTGTVGGIDTVGGKTSTWRAYDGDTPLLLKHWLTTTTAAFTEPESGTKVYDGKAPTIDLANNVTFSNTSDVDKTYVYVAAGNKNVGNYPLLYSDQQHYDIINQAYAITPATLTATIDVSKTYDGTVEAPADLTNAYTLTGQVNGETVDLSITGASGQFANADVGTDKPITYTGLKLDGANAANYILQVAATGTINKAHLTVTANSVADAVTYGDTTLGDKLTYSLSGLVNGEDASLVSGKPVYSTKAWDGTKTGNVGTYNDLVVSGTGTLDAKNYDFVLQGTTAPGTLTITPATLTLKADAVTMNEGDTLPAFTGVASGYVNGDSASESPVFNWTGSGTPTIGTYGILGYLGGKSAGAYSNYELLQAAGNTTALTVAQKRIPFTSQYQGQTVGNLFKVHDGNVFHDQAGTIYTVPAPYQITPTSIDISPILSSLWLDSNGHLLRDREALTITGIIGAPGSGDKSNRQDKENGFVLAMGNNTGYVISHNP